jgi:hypothetical protein
MYPKRAKHSTCSRLVRDDTAVLYEQAKEHAMTEDWRDGFDDDSEDMQVEEYDLTSSPNDFNTLTMYSFIESGAVQIPGFQRSYVWDIKRASKLIESIIMGLPVPQVFLYEKGRNNFLVIDGQQSLMTIFFFFKKRFPKIQKRSELRRIFSRDGAIPEDVLYNDDFFSDFNLRLPKLPSGTGNKFSGLNYSTLGDYKSQFDLRTIRNVIVKQISPSDDDSSIYEMFQRLNTGGINLTPQEIRASLYHSPFYSMLFELNMDPRWRRLLGQQEPDLHVRDIEILLRALGLAYHSDTYKSSMARFLNEFSKEAQRYSQARVAEVRGIVEWFLSLCDELPRTAFYSRAGKFSVPLFEAIFAAAVSFRELAGRQRIGQDTIEAVRNDPDFLSHSETQSTNTVNVQGRINTAKRIVRDAWLVRR